MRIIFAFILFLTNQSALAQQSSPTLIVRTKTMEILDLEKYYGTKTVIIIFTSWCKYCHEEMLHLQKMQEKVGKNRLQIIAINFDEMDDEKDYLEFAKKFPFYFAKLSDISQTSFIKKPNSVPILYFLDEKANLVDKLKF